MSSLALPPVSAAAIPAVPNKSGDPARTRDAARQFEALLIGQILHAAHESGTGWLGTPEDSSSDCATDYGEQQFAAVLAQAGGLGIASMIERGLKAQSSPPESSGPTPDSARRDTRSGSTSPALKSPEP